MQIGDAPWGRHRARAGPCGRDGPTPWDPWTSNSHQPLGPSLLPSSRDPYLYDHDQGGQETCVRAGRRLSTGADTSQVTPAVAEPPQPWPARHRHFRDGRQRMGPPVSSACAARRIGPTQEVLGQMESRQLYFKTKHPPRRYCAM
eukprot:scaffold9338_cov113-Isochrysis_galbana.AAC.13